jgi:hypothetical protein
VFALDVELAQVALARISVNLSAENFTRACEHGKVLELDEVLGALSGEGEIAPLSWSMQRRG